MSEISGGPGWWQASDGRWYPPQSRPGAQPPPSPPPLLPARKTNSNAVVALVFGILGLSSCGPFLGIPAIILAGKADKEIEASGGEQGGEGLATAGRVLGWVATIIYGIVILAIVVITVIAIIAADPEAAHSALAAI